MNRKIKIGLLGVGHLGKIHLKCLQETNFELVGVYDPDPIVQKWVRENYDVPVYKDLYKLLDDVDAVDIVSSTITHYDLAIEALKKGKHAFIEKPISSSVEEAEEILQLTKQNDLKVQVGHVERYNPAIVSLKNRKIQPKFIEGHRLTTFNTRGNDVSVMLDLMIHDLDLVLHLVGSEVKEIQANGVCVVNDTPDICNARITFQNGCVANLTASRISMKHLRKLRMFQGNEYISVDFLNKETQIVQLQPLGDQEADQFMTIDTSEGKKILHVESPSIHPNNAIVDELNDFYDAIYNDTKVSISGEDATNALKLAYRIASEVGKSFS